MNFRTNYIRPTSIGVECNGESMTEPDQSLSVEEIIRRFSVGTLDVNEISREVHYLSDDIDYPNPQILDITDIEDIARTRTDIENRIKIESEKQVD